MTLSPLFSTQRMLKEKKEGGSEINSAYRAASRAFFFSFVHVFSLGRASQETLFIFHSHVFLIIFMFTLSSSFFF